MRNDRCERNKAYFTLKRVIWAYLKTFNAGFSRNEFNNKWMLITQSDYDKYIPASKEKSKIEDESDPFNGL